MSCSPKSFRLALAFIALLMLCGSLRAQEPAGGTGSIHGGGPSPKDILGGASGVTASGRSPKRAASRPAPAPAASRRRPRPAQPGRQPALDADDYNDQGNTYLNAAQY